MKSRELAALCGVGQTLVLDVRPEALNETSNAPTTVTTSDGREYPIHQKPRQPKEEQPIEEEVPETRGIVNG